MTTAEKVREMEWHAITIGCAPEALRVQMITEAAMRIGVPEVSMACAVRAYLKSRKKYN